MKVLLEHPLATAIAGVVTVVAALPVLREWVAGTPPWRPERTSSVVDDLGLVIGAIGLGLRALLLAHLSRRRR